MKVLSLGTRGSRLALWQAQYVARQLQEKAPDIEVKIKIIKTQGDKILDVALSQIGDKGLFTKEIENELLDGQIDFAVHSMKDLPAVLGPGLCLGAVLKREYPGDVLLSHKGYSLKRLPLGAVIGTSSLRRIAQMKAYRPDLQMVNIRGNVETRIKKMREQNLDGIILAYAGVSRLGFENEITDKIPFDIILPAVGQGALAVEMREGDADVAAILTTINDPDTYTSTVAERAFLAELEGGCQVPVASLASIHGPDIMIQGLVASLDGKILYSDDLVGDKNHPEEVGKKLAGILLASGAGAILNEIRNMGD